MIIAMKLLALYKRMLAVYGPQHWWPAESQYEVVVGALLTQNTNWANAAKAIANLKRAGMLEPGRLMKADRRTLESLIRPSGFYRQKAVRLASLTRKYMEIQDRGPQILRAGAKPQNKPKPPAKGMRKELLSVKGVGPETADSILLYAYSKPHFVIDAYTRRFCAHHGLERAIGGKDYDSYKRFFEKNLPRSVPLYKEYHALIVEWGKRNRSQDAGKNY
jgi:endonuclease-3 related protein